MGFASRLEPTGGARIAWSYLGGLAALALAGFGFAVADPIQAGTCPDADVACSLGVVLVGLLIGAVVGVALAGWAFRLGWEWVLVSVTGLVALPSALDAAGSAAWALPVLIPLLAALATLRGSSRPRWRPVAIVAACALVVAWSAVGIVAGGP